jgi:hypothetical protein
MFVIAYQPTTLGSCRIVRMLGDVLTFGTEVEAIRHAMLLNSNPNTRHYYYAQAAC